MSPRTVKLAQARRVLGQRLALDGAQLDSVMALAGSELDVSLRGLLRNYRPPEP